MTGSATPQPPVGPPRSEGERVVRQFELSNLALAVLAFVITHVVAGAGPFLWGVLVGGALGVLNLRSMVFIGRRILTSRQHSRAMWGALFGLKLIILCTVVWLCLTYLPIHSLGFLVGFSTILPATLVLAVIRALERAPGPQATSHGERRL